MQPNPMRGVYVDVVMTLLGSVMIAVNLTIESPRWLLTLISCATGAMLVFAIADYRDVLRRRAGLLR